MTRTAFWHLRHKLSCFGFIAARHRLSNQSALVGRVAFYGLLLFVFSRLWTIVARGDTEAIIEPEQFIWYIAITEWIVLSLPPIHADVQDEMRSGDLLYRLTRPIAYPWAKLAEASGDLVVRLVPMAGAGAAGAYLLTGALPLSLATAACLVVVGLLAAFVALTFQLAIGLGAFWIHDCRPLYWIWQKGTFLLGGLLIPLELYPGWLRTIAEVSPFAAILHGPGHLAFDGSLVAAGLVVLELLGWLVVALFVVHMLYRRGLRRIDGAGGG